MKIVWSIIFFELLVYFLFEQYIENLELASLILVLVNIPFVIIAIFKIRNKIHALLLYVGFSLRLILMFIDIYGKSVISIPHSGVDSDNFLLTGLRIANDLSLLFDNIYGGIYSKILGIIFYLGPDDRIIPQYINVLLSISVILIALKVFAELQFNERIKYIALVVMVFFPHSIIFSGILLRETLIVFLVILSFYCFVKWYKNNNIILMVFSILLILLASMFHSGVIGLIIGYLLMLLLYNHKQKLLVFSTKSLLLFMLLILIIGAFSFVPKESLPFLNKFTQYAEDIDDIYNIASSGRGGSSYLQGITIDSPIDFIIYSPIKMIYFIASPLPWDWRNILDITTFLYDGLIYLILFLYPIINFKKIVKKDPLTLTIFVMIISTILIFGIGISNAGTAIRHRYKIFYLMIILFMAIYNNKSMASKKNT